MKYVYFVVADVAAWGEIAGEKDGSCMRERKLWE